LPLYGQLVGYFYLIFMTTTLLIASLALTALLIKAYGKKTLYWIQRNTAKFFFLVAKSLQPRADIKLIDSSKLQLFAY